jgi:hypothetical protein
MCCFHRDCEYLLFKQAMKPCLEQRFVVFLLLALDTNAIAAADPGAGGSGVDFGRAFAAYYRLTLKIGICYEWRNSRQEAPGDYRQRTGLMPGSNCGSGQSA